MRYSSAQVRSHRKAVGEQSPWSDTVGVRAQATQHGLPQGCVGSHEVKVDLAVAVKPLARKTRLHPRPCMGSSLWRGGVAHAPGAPGLCTA